MMGKLKRKRDKQVKKLTELIRKKLIVSQKEEVLREKIDELNIKIKDGE